MRPLLAGRRRLGGVDALAQVGLRDLLRIDRDLQIIGRERGRLKDERADGLATRGRERLRGQTRGRRDAWVDQAVRQLQAVHLAAVAQRKGRGSGCLAQLVGILEDVDVLLPVTTPTGPARSTRLKSPAFISDLLAHRQAHAGGETPWTPAIGV